MKKTTPKSIRVLAIAPSTRGCGFAVLEDQLKLVDWGVKSIKGDKSAGTLIKVEEMIGHYRPHKIVLEDHSSKQSRRSPRIQALSREIVALAKKRDIGAVLRSQNQVRKGFFADGQGTKHALAEILATRFSEELGSRLPPKRRPWMSEDYRMDIFDAVALALASNG